MREIDAVKSAGPCLRFKLCSGYHQEMEELIAKRQFKDAWDLIIAEIEQDVENKEELKELFSFVLNTYW